MYISYIYFVFSCTIYFNCKIFENIFSSEMYVCMCARIDL